MKLWPFRRNNKYGLKKIKFKSPSTGYFQVVFDGEKITLNKGDVLDIQLILKDNQYQLYWKQPLIIE